MVSALVYARQSCKCTHTCITCTHEHVPQATAHCCCMRYTRPAHSTEPRTASHAQRLCRLPAAALHARTHASQALEGALCCQVGARNGHGVQGQVQALGHAQRLTRQQPRTYNVHLLLRLAHGGRGAAAAAQQVVRRTCLPTYHARSGPATGMPRAPGSEGCCTLQALPLCFSMCGVGGVSKRWCCGAARARL